MNSNDDGAEGDKNSKSFDAVSKELSASVDVTELRNSSAIKSVNTAPKAEKDKTRTATKNKKEVKDNGVSLRPSGEKSSFNNNHAPPHASRSSVGSKIRSAAVFSESSFHGNSSISVKNEVNLTGNGSPVENFGDEIGDNMNANIGHLNSNCNSNSKIPGRRQKNTKYLAWSANTLRKLAESNDDWDEFKAILLTIKKDKASSDTSLPTSSSAPLPLFDIDSQNSAGKTALHLASWKGPIAKVIALLEAGADINIYCTAPGSYGKTPLFFAITRSRDNVVIELLKRGANVKIVCNKGQTPRSIAVTHLQPSTIDAINAAEIQQADAEWVNFYPEHHDGQLYGDLDPRFVDQAFLDKWGDTLEALKKEGKFFEGVDGQYKHMVSYPTDYSLRYEWNRNRSGLCPSLRGPGSNEIDIISSSSALSSASMSTSNSLAAGDMKSSDKNENQLQSELKLVNDSAKQLTDPINGSGRIEYTKPVNFSDLIKHLCDRPDFFEKSLEIFMMTKDANDYSDKELKCKQISDTIGKTEKSFFKISRKTENFTMLQLGIKKNSKIENIIAILDIAGVDVDEIAIEDKDYGTTAIMFACVRCNDLVVTELLKRRANVKIVNVKGQSLRSLAIAHLQDDTIRAIEKAEETQRSVEWVNYRRLKKDERAHCNVDPRFVDPAYSKLLSEELDRYIEAGLECKVKDVHISKVINPLTEELLIMYLMHLKSKKKGSSLTDIVETIKNKSAQTEKLGGGRLLEGKDSVAGICEPRHAEVAAGGKNVDGLEPASLTPTLEQLVGQINSNEFFSFSKSLEHYVSINGSTVSSKFYMPSGLNILHIASIQTNVLCINAILHIAKINVDEIAISDKDYGTTAIMFACMRKNDSVVIELLKHGASVKIVNVKGQSLRSLAIAHLQEDTIRAIEEAEESQKSQDWVIRHSQFQAKYLPFDIDPRFFPDASYDFQNNKSKLGTIPEIHRDKVLNPSHNIYKVNGILSHQVKSAAIVEPTSGVSVGIERLRVDSPDSTIEGQGTPHGLSGGSASAGAKNNKPLSAAAPSFSPSSLTPKTLASIGSSPRLSASTDVHSFLIHDISEINNTASTRGPITCNKDGTFDFEGIIFRNLKIDKKIMRIQVFPVNYVGKVCQDYGKMNEESCDFTWSLSRTSNPAVLKCIDLNLILGDLYKKSCGMDSKAFKKVMAGVSTGCRIRATCMLGSENQVDRILNDTNLRADSHFLNFNVAKFEIVEVNPELHRLMELIENRERLDFELLKSRDEYLKIPPLPITFFSSASESLVQKSREAINSSILYRYIDNPTRPSDSSRIFYVSDRVGLQKMDEMVTDYIRSTDHYFPIGIDCEWKPFPTMHKVESPIAMLQIGMEIGVFVVDMAELVGDIYYKNRDRLPLFASTLTTFMDSVLGKLILCERSFVLGFECADDLRRLNQTCPYLKCFKKFDRVVDLSNFSAGEIKMQKNGRSLSRLSFKILGFPINKQYQMCNWERRPLNFDQVHYAAMDAMVMLKIFYKMIKPCPNLHGTCSGEMLTLMKASLKCGTCHGNFCPYCLEVMSSSSSTKHVCSIASESISASFSNHVDNTESLKPVLRKFETLFKRYITKSHFSG